MWSCQAPSKDLEGFDRQTWASDRFGCQGRRLSMKADFERIKSQLMGQSQRYVAEQLGKPDKIDLSSRNGKFFIYYLSGPDCPGGQQTQAYYIRFSPIDMVNEVSIRFSEHP